MPRKRRKAIASITPDIPYPKVRVEWIDCVSDSGWANEKEFDKMLQKISNAEDRLAALRRHYGDNVADRQG